MAIVKTFEARVVNGKLVIDQPSPYPEGTVVHLMVTDEPVTEADLLEEMGEEGFAAFKASLKRSKADVDTGRTYSLEEVVKGRRRVR
jgi:hypothetical protein